MPSDPHGVHIRRITFDTGTSPGGWRAIPRVIVAVLLAALAIGIGIALFFSAILLLAILIPIGAVVTWWTLRNRPPVTVGYSGFVWHGDPTSRSHVGWDEVTAPIRAEGPSVVVPHLSGTDLTLPARSSRQARKAAEALETFRRQLRAG